MKAQYEKCPICKYKSVRIRNGTCIGGCKI